VVLVLGSRYKELGVDVKKPGVEQFSNAIDDIYPDAFCVVYRDPSDESMGLVLHTDSAGSKPIQAYLMYRETGEASWLKGLAQDALAMNINDILCVGAEPMSFVDYVAYNPINIDRIAMLGALAEGFKECKTLLAGEGTPIIFGGGETADLPDLLRTLDVCVTIHGRVHLNRVISGDAVKPGDVIIGLRSGGRARFEKKANSGIMSNGHTLARSCLLSPTYLEKYPEISNQRKGRYTGRFRLDDTPQSLGESIGEALLHPTRLFSPIASAILKDSSEGIHGIVHNTGGGQTKCLRVGKNVRYIKDSLPDPDPIFYLIKSESGIEWKEMYQDFNMGVGFEITIDPDYVERVLRVAKSFGIDAQVIGRCEQSRGENALEIRTPNGVFHYN
jgi:phosphoribosylformylglycinamidine cyclo-ligase